MELHTRRPRAGVSLSRRAEQYTLWNPSGRIAGLRGCGVPIRVLLPWPDRAFPKLFFFFSAPRKCNFGSFHFFKHTCI